MANGVLMPKVGITVESCIIGKWKKAVGDHVAMGEILFDYETDKASFECESTAEGEVLEIFFQDGDEVPCLVNVCAIGAQGEDCSALRPDGARPRRLPPLPQLPPLPWFPARRCPPGPGSWRRPPVWTPPRPPVPVPTDGSSSVMCAASWPRALPSRPTSPSRRPLPPSRLPRLPPERRHSRT